MQPQDAVVLRAKGLALVAPPYDAEMADHSSADRKEGTRWPS